MLELTPTNLSVLAVLLAQLLLMALAPKAPFAWQRPLGYLALAIGSITCGWQLVAAGALAWAGAWRVAAEHALCLYLLATATWLAWKAARPF